MEAIVTFRNKTKITVAVLGIALAVGSFPAMSHAEHRASTVKVQLPLFRILMNTFNPVPQLEAYPPLVYEGITYIAMTWDNCRRLGLAINWSSDAGLSIQSEAEGSLEVPYSYEDESGHNNDINGVYEARIADYPIAVNGTPVDNDTEPYPILSFRDITYFPLTWRFTHDEFQWMTNWSDTDGFTILTGHHGFSGISGIYWDMGNDLFIQTNLYGTLKLDKSLQGNVEAVSSDDSLTKAYEKQNSGLVASDPAALHNQTRLDNRKLMLGDTELGVPSNTPAAEPEDTVIAAGSAKLVSVSVSEDRNDADVYIVKEGRAEPVDRHQPLYRKRANSDGSFWFSTANVSYAMHHTSYTEQHLWLIKKDGTLLSLNQLLGVDSLSDEIGILSILQDGAMIVSYQKGAYTNGDPSTDIYRIGTDGRAVKMYESIKDQIYADEAGEIYVLTLPGNRITRLSSGTSVVIDDIRMFQAVRSGNPQPLNNGQ
jgi:hypothetical protein